MRRHSVPLILSVDDDPAMRLLTREALEGAGFAVIEAEDGPSAVRAIEQQGPNLVLLDVTMPGQDGFETCRQARTLPSGAEVPIIMVTGLDDVESISRAYEVGATDFISKPLNWQILVQRVRYLLRASRAFGDLKESQSRLENAQRIARLGHWELDLTSNALYCSEEAYRIFGATTPIPLSLEIAFSRFHREDQPAVMECIKQARETSEPYSLEHRIVQLGGKVRIVEHQGAVTRDSDGKPVRLTGTIRDVTLQKQAEEQIRYLAYYDSLTGLPNRLMFKEQLAGALEFARRKDQRVAVLFLDLDRFKLINDTLGHSAGDELLRQMSGRLRDSVRRSDYVAAMHQGRATDLIARLGGDEFTVMLTEFDNIHNVAKVADRVLESAKKPFHIDGQELFATLSIGIAVYPEDGDNLDALLKNADAAMFHAKTEGRDNFQYYSQTMNAFASARLALESDLRRAVERQEFVLYYQPKVDLASNKIVGMEALVRWRHPERGLVSPGDFISVAEETGLIVPLGNWVLRQACEQTKRWADRGFTPLKVSVNLSPRQFRQADLVEVVNDALRDSRLDPAYLELEITESAVIHREDEALEALRALKPSGISLSIDDFGTGYSSLSYLTRFPIDALKIDRAFLHALPNNGDQAVVVRAIIAMAKSLGLVTIAEGVETDAQRGFLAREACDQMQGFLISEPVSVREFEALLEPQFPRALASV
jgi:diguanylate cyclase (GGDEF)-like protein/PAS domain S-box-containing protein